MRSFLFFTLVVFTVLYSFSQKETELNQLKRKSISFDYISISPINFFYGKETGGLALRGDVAVNIKNELIMLSIYGASEIPISMLGSPSNYNTYRTMDILYTKKMRLSDIWSLNLGIGCGLFNKNRIKFERIENTGYWDDMYYKDAEYRKIITRYYTVDFPLLMKFNFKVSKRIDMGLFTGFHYNSQQPIQQIGFLIQWNFRSKGSSEL